MNKIHLAIALLLTATMAASAQTTQPATPDGPRIVRMTVRPAAEPDPIGSRNIDFISL